MYMMPKLMIKLEPLYIYTQIRNDYFFNETIYDIFLAVIGVKKN